MAVRPDADRQASTQTGQERSRIELSDSASPGRSSPRTEVRGLLFYFLRVDLRRGGTRAPFSRASLNAMAMACFRLVTLRPDPDRSVPRFRRRIVLSTVSEAFFEYLRVRCGMVPPSWTEAGASVMPNCGLRLAAEGRLSIAKRRSPGPTSGSATLPGRCGRPPA
jgi:hypothetical protein